MKPDKWIYVAGIVLCLSGCFHSVVWFVVGGSWEGSVSIRKPMLFGVSTGLTLVSLAWVQSKLSEKRYDAWVSPAFALAMLVEVGIITVQYWRGQPSHFNHESGVDTFLDRTITILITFACVVILDLSFRSRKLKAVTEAMRLAIHGGLALLIVSCGFGFVNYFYGEYLIRVGRPPEIFGSAGVMKFPHGVAIHAIQFFPFLVWLAARMNVDQAAIMRIVIYAIAGMIAFLAFSVVQTFSGRARFDLNLPGVLCLMATIGLLGRVGYEFFRAVPSLVRR